MKITQNKIFPSLATATTLVLPIILLSSIQTSALEVPQRVTNGLFRSSSSDFFLEGKRQFEREIEILLQRQLSEPEDILEISDELRMEQERSPQEIPNLSPDNVDSSGGKKLQRFRGD